MVVVSKRRAGGSVGKSMRRRLQNARSQCAQHRANARSTGPMHRANARRFSRRASCRCCHSMRRRAAHRTSWLAAMPRCCFESYDAQGGLPAVPHAAVPSPRVRCGFHGWDMADSATAPHFCMPLDMSDGRSKHQVALRRPNMRTQSAAAIFNCGFCLVSLRCLAIIRT